MSTVKCTNIEALTGGGAPDNLLPVTCSAWINFNGTGTVAIRDSYNVSLLTDNGTGDYTITFAVPMANANYSVCCSSKCGASNVRGGTFVGVIDLTGGSGPTTAVNYTTGNIRIGASSGSSSAANSAPTDLDAVDVQIFGGQ